MIPKIIHSCWFGWGEKSELILQCQASWKKYCPDYVFMEWNEDNFMINDSIPYVKQAYSRKEYAFVSDFVRVWALNTYGGIYLDTDIEVLKSLDDLLENNVFLWFADEKNIWTAVIGWEKNHAFFGDFLKLYEWLEQWMGNNALTNQILFNYWLKKEWDMNASYRIKDINIFPKAYFEPIDYKKRLKTPSQNKERYVTDESYTIHYSNLSWITWKMWMIHYIGISLQKLWIRKFIKICLIKMWLLDPKKYWYD